MKRYATALLIALAPCSALADQAAATQCRGKLNPEATMIYDTSLPLVTPKAVLRDVVRDQTRTLVGDGKVSMASARTNAESAGECLKLLQH